MDGEVTYLVPYSIGSLLRGLQTRLFLSGTGMTHLQQETELQSLNTPVLGADRMSTV
jgi:hypothetical protein